MSSRLPIICDSDAPLPEQPLAGHDPIPLAAEGRAGYPGWLADKNGRRLRYLRLSVTDRCDLRCQYCMPEEGIEASPRSEFLTFEEIIRLVSAFRTMGVRTVRLTGGEPLVRRGIERLVKMLRDEAGIDDIAMTSNATAMRKMAKILSENGLKRLNVSVDSLNSDRFRRMTRGGDLQRVLSGIQAAQDAGIAEIKTNSVVVRGHNNDELADIVQWAWAHNITPRFIELMPLGEGAQLGRDAVVPISEMQASLSELIKLDGNTDYRSDRGPAGYVYARNESGHKVGFIGAVTDNFCHRCNRVRITARGEIRACLASPAGFSLRDAMRQHPGGVQNMQTIIEDALFEKRDGHEFYIPGVERHHEVHMSRIGG